MSPALLPFFRWADHIWISQWIRDSTWAFALIEVFHLFGLTLLLGTLTVLNLRLFGWGLGGYPLKSVATDALPWTFVGMAVSITSGILLFLSEAMKCYGSLPFFVKMGLLSAALVLTFTFHRHLAKTDAPSPVVSKCAAGLSVALWFGVGLAGRAIAFFATIRESGTMVVPMSFLDQLRNVLDPDGLISTSEEVRTYECDGLTNFRVKPIAVVLPTSTEEVQGVLRICHRERIPFVARGSGTGLSGGALPVTGGIVISLAKMNRILEVDYPNQRVVVEPGVINLNVTVRVSPDGYFYAPDPSSQSVCSIGGNVAENAGGAHCLKYGFTTTHVLGIDVVLPDGTLAHFGSKTLDAPGYDLAGVFVGSEGTLGVATKVTLRIVKKPECVQTLLAAFDTTNEAGAAVSDIIKAGMLPAAIEMMDNLAIQAAEAAVHANYPNCGGLLLVELDGPVAEVDTLIAQVSAICRENGAGEVRVAQTEEERAVVWKGRKAAFAAVGRISPNYIVQDGVIPRTALPKILTEMDRLATEWGLRVANVFHAGDGNLHPLVLYDRRIEGQEHAAERLAERILELCIEMGGSITGEHGVGEEKKHMMGKMFAEPDLATMQKLRCAFDPLSLANPTKVFPRPRMCGEAPGEYKPHPLETAGIAERF